MVIIHVLDSFLVIWYVLSTVINNQPVKLRISGYFTHEKANGPEVE